MKRVKFETKAVTKTVTENVQIPTIVDEAGPGGFEEYLGNYVDVWCGNYIYHGKLTGVNGDHIVLEDVSVVYETGNLNDNKFVDAQKFANPRKISKSFVESWGLSNVST